MTAEADYVKAIKAQLKPLPAFVRDALKQACAGDFTRLAPDGKGGFTVHNRSQVGAPPPPPKKKVNTGPKPGPRPAPPKARLRTKVEPEALSALLNYGDITSTPVAPPPKAKTIRPGVTVTQAPPRPRVDESIKSPEPDEWAIANFDWESVDLEATANALRVRLADGVPEAIRYTYHSDVLALYGLDLDLMDGALRHPQRVEIRPESYSKDKRYPVLGFHRGDVTVILGMRQPLTPKVIAAYATSRLDADTHRVGHTGGGGTRKAGGLPTNPRQVVKQLRARGAEVTLNPLEEGQPVEVTYKGKSVGKISTGEHVDKDTATSDYQRTLRRMAALDARQ